MKNIIQIFILFSLIFFCYQPAWCHNSDFYPNNPIGSIRFLTLPFDSPQPVANGFFYSKRYDSQLGLHNAIDYYVKQDSVIKAAADGIAMKFYSGTDNGSGDYGNTVLIRHNVKDPNGDYYYTLYAHLNSIESFIPNNNRFNPDYSKWTPVQRGQVIGKSGLGGLGSGWPHLHFQVFTKNYANRYIKGLDPYDLYKVSLNSEDSAYYYPPKININNYQYGRKYSSCGPNMLWLSDPPTSYIKDDNDFHAEHIFNSWNVEKGIYQTRLDNGSFVFETGHNPILISPKLSPSVNTNQFQTIELSMRVNYQYGFPPQNGYIYYTTNFDEKFSDQQKIFFGQVRLDGYEKIYRATFDSFSPSNLYQIAIAPLKNSFSTIHLNYIRFVSHFDSWYFENSSNGWNLNTDPETFAFDNKWLIKPISGSPQAISPWLNNVKTGTDKSLFKSFALSFSVDGNESENLHGKVYFDLTDDGNGFTDALSYAFDVNPDGQIHTYSIPLPYIKFQNPLMRNCSKIFRVRVDFYESDQNEKFLVAFESAKFLKEVALDVNGNEVFLDDNFYRRRSSNSISDTSYIKIHEISDKTFQNNFPINFKAYATGCCSDKYKWSFTKNPLNFEIDNDGNISGNTGNVSGSFKIVIRAEEDYEDQSGFAEEEFTITVNDDPDRNALTIYNDGKGTLDVQSISVTKGSEWLNVDSPSTLSIDGGQFETIPISVDRSALSNGDYEGTIEISSNDPNDNPILIPVELTVDGDSNAPSKPEDIIVSPGSWFSSGALSIDWSNSDDPSGIEGAFYKTGSPPVSKDDGTFTTNKPITFKPQEEGEQNIFIWLKDNAGNYDHRNLGYSTFFFDRSPPEILRKNPTNDETNVDTDVEILIEVVDENSGMNASCVSLMVNDIRVKFELVNYSGMYQIKYKPETSFDFNETVNVNVELHDLSSPSNSLETVSWRFTTIKKPQAIITNTPKSIDNRKEYEINMSGDNLTHYKFKIDDNLLSQRIAIDEPIHLSGLTDGDHSLFVIGQDIYGNWQSENDASVISWMIDSVPPQAVIEYAPNEMTSKPVVATLVSDESIEIINNNGESSKTFHENGEFLFKFMDQAENTNSTLAQVNWIVKTALELPKNITASTGDVISVPVYLNNPKFVGVEGINFSIYYDPDILLISKQEAFLSDNLLDKNFNYDLEVNSGDNGTIEIALSAYEDLFSDSGDLLFLEFIVKGKPKESSPLNFSYAHLNEQPISFSNAVFTVNGKPFISEIQDMLIPRMTPAITEFSISDLETLPNELNVSVSSSNNELIPIENMIIKGIGEVRTLSITPVTDLSGSSLITVTVDDNYASASSVFELIVNDPPVVHDQVVSTKEDNSLSIDISASDSEMDELTYVVVSQSTNGILTGTAPNLYYLPDSDYYGPDSFTYYARDYLGQSETVCVSISVISVNDLPHFQSGNDIAIDEDAGVQIIENWATNINKGAANESNQILTFVVNSLNPELFSDGPAVLTNGTLTFKTASDANGSAEISVQLQDDGLENNMSEPSYVTINVNPINDPPKFKSGSDITVFEDAGDQISENWATEINPGAADEYNQLLRFETSTDNQALFEKMPEIAPDGILTFKPASNAYGKAIVSVTLYDDAAENNMSEAQSFTIQVIPVDDPPTIDCKQKTLVTNQNFQVSVPFSIDDMDTELEKLQLSCIFLDSTLIEDYVFKGSGNDYVLTITPGLNQSGSSEITIVVNDDVNRAETYLTLTIHHVTGELSHEIAYPQEPVFVSFSLVSDDPVEGLNLNISYDSDVLTPTQQGASLNQESLMDYVLDVNTKTPGFMELAIRAEGTPITVNEKILNLHLMVLNNAPVNETSFLTITYGELNEREMTCYSGSVSITGVSIAGKVNYYSEIKGDDKPLPNIEISLTGDCELTTTTDKTGSYLFYAIRPGNYTLTASYYSEFDKKNGIDAVDASRVARNSIGLHDFNCMMTLAGDVTGNGSVSAMDSSKIGRYKVDLIDRLNHEDRQWLFLSETITHCEDMPVQYTPHRHIFLDSDRLNENFVSVKLGDVDGSFSTKSPKKKNVVKTVKTFETTSTSFTLPLALKQVLDLEGTDITLDFNDDEIAIEKVELYDGKLKLNNYKLLTHQSDAGKITILLFAQSDIVCVNEPLLTIHCKHIGSGNDSVLSITQFTSNGISDSGGFSVNNTIADSVKVIFHKAEYK